MQLNDVDVEITKRRLKCIPAEITPAALEAMLTAFDFPDESEVTDDG